MILVDRMLEHSEDGTKCKAIKNVTFNEAFFQGHYPGFPVMPGVLIVEAMAQAGAAMMLSRPDTAGKIPLIGAIDDARFKRMVVPGDQLILECELLWMRGMVGRMKCQATVDGELAASMELTFKLATRDF
jgi:beta-hydroxyacyl-ACP dehydratase FabZ